jgi:hypothetical protein
MAAQDRPTFTSRLLLPLAWEPLDGAPGRMARAALDRANGSVFDVLLQRIDLEAAPRGSDERLAEALVPLRAKLDLVIEMLSRLSYRDVTLPELCEVELGLDRIAWSSPESVAAGSWLRLQLFFHDAYREPVTLFGEVIGCTNGREDGGWWVQAEMPEMADDVGESFARLIFLAHRRSLAQRPVRAALRSAL